MSKKNPNSNKKSGGAGFIITLLILSALSGFSFSGIPDAAGVEKQHIRLFFLSGERMSAAAQHRAQSFGIALIHLAAVGFDKNFHRSSKIR